MRPQRIVVNPWAPEYAAPFAVEEDAADITSDTTVEVSGPWSAIDPPAAPADHVLFIDGVQRVDARITLLDGPDAVSGIAASIAAGTVRHRHGRAAVDAVRVHRGLFTPSSDVTLTCGGVSYGAVPVTDTSPEELRAAVNEQMRALEKRLAFEAAADLVVIDGPLSGSVNVTGAVGVVKTHRRRYLPDAEQALVAELAPGQRTPLFLTRTAFSRFSWYQRLPGSVDHAWAGVIRCEVSETQRGAAVALAERCAATLPRFASAAHRDPRAPQNLTPIGQLERHLRHRLGDRAVVERLLRRACHAWRPSGASGEDGDVPT